MKVAIKLNDWEPGEILKEDCCEVEVSPEAIEKHIHSFIENYKKNFDDPRIITVIMEYPPVRAIVTRSIKRLPEAAQR